METGSRKYLMDRNDEESDIAHYGTTEPKPMAGSNSSHSTVTWSGEIFGPETAQSGEVLGSSMNLAACAFGASMLSLPYTLDISGGLIGVVLIVLLGALAVIAGNSIMHAGLCVQRSTYNGIVTVAFGKRVGAIHELLLMLCLFVSAVSYVVGLADIVPEMFPVFSSFSRTFRILIIYAALFPLTTVGNLSAFGSSSMFACIGCYIQSFALMAAAIFSENISVPSADLIFSFKPTGILFSLPMIAFTYAYHYVLTDTFMEMKDPTIQRLKATTLSTTVTLSACYILVAISGYCLYGGKNVPSDVLSGFGQGSIVIIIALWSIGLLLFSTYALLVIPLRKRFEVMLYGEQTTHWNLQRVSIAFGVGFFVVLSAILLKDLSLANAVAGGCIAIVMFVFPGLLDFHRFENFPKDGHPLLRVQGSILLFVGTLAALMGIFGNMLPFDP